MRILIIAIIILFSICNAQNSGSARLKELRTKIDPIRTFDLPEEAPRARIISTAFLRKSHRKMKSNYKDNSRMDDFRRWRLDELTDREMRTSNEVKNSAKSPFEGSEENLGEFFPTRH